MLIIFFGTTMIFLRSLPWSHFSVSGAFNTALLISGIVRSSESSSWNRILPLNDTGNENVLSTIYSSLNKGKDSNKLWSRNVRNVAHNSSAMCGAIGRDEDQKGFEDCPLVTFQFRKLVHADHEIRNSSIEGIPFSVILCFFNSPMKDS